MRLFTIARFGVYAVIVTIGLLHLASRGEGASTPDEVHGPWISGQTSQGYGVGARMERSRVVKIGLGWGARCSNGLPLHDQRAAFSEGIGRFERRGARFGGEFGGSDVWPDGTPYVLRARVVGAGRDGEAHGTAAFTAVYDDRGRRVTCDSGPIRWSARP